MPLEHRPDSIIPRSEVNHPKPRAAELVLARGLHGPMRCVDAVQRQQINLRDQQSAIPIPKQSRALAGSKLTPGARTQEDGQKHR